MDVKPFLKKVSVFLKCLLPGADAIALAEQQIVSKANDPLGWVPCRRRREGGGWNAPLHLRGKLSAGLPYHRLGVVASYFFRFLRQNTTPPHTAAASTTTGHAPARATASRCTPFTKFCQPSENALTMREPKPSLGGE